MISFYSHWTWGLATVTFLGGSLAQGVCVHSNISIPNFQTEETYGGLCLCPQGLPDKYGPLNSVLICIGKSTLSQLMNVNHLQYNEKSIERKTRIGISPWPCSNTYQMCSARKWGLRSKWENHIVLIFPVHMYISLGILLTESTIKD